jgi:hypothetical protein
MGEATGQHDADLVVGGWFAPTPAVRPLEGPKRHLREAMAQGKTLSGQTSPAASGQTSDRANLPCRPVNVRFSNYNSAVNLI